MKRRDFLAIPIVAGLLAFGFAVNHVIWPLIVVAYVLLHPAQIGPLVDSWQTRSGSVDLRINLHKEDGGFLPGAYYVFQARPEDTSDWTEVMTFRHDGQVPIPEDQVVVVNSEVVGVYMGWQFAVTTDGGRTWEVWNAKTDLPGWQCCNYGLIDDVLLENSGTGTMILNPIPGRAGEVARLETVDFGKHWFSAGEAAELEVGGQSEIFGGISWLMPVASDFSRRRRVTHSGCPRENVCCKSHNGILRDELLNGMKSHSLRESQVLIERRRVFYNTERPHNSLKYGPPARGP